MCSNKSTLCSQNKQQQGSRAELVVASYPSLLSTETGVFVCACEVIREVSRASALDLQTADSRNRCRRADIAQCGGCGCVCSRCMYQQQGSRCTRQGSGREAIKSTIMLGGSLCQPQTLCGGAANGLDACLWVQCADKKSLSLPTQPQGMHYFNSDLFFR